MHKQLGMQDTHRAALGCSALIKVNEGQLVKSPTLRVDLVIDIAQYSD